MHDKTILTVKTNIEDWGETTMSSFSVVIATDRKTYIRTFAYITE